MPNSLCPFINDPCTLDCVFNDGSFNEGDPENCRLMCAARALQGFEHDLLVSPKETPNAYLKNILSELSGISINTSYDQTDSSSIKHHIEEIKKLLTKD